MLISIVKQGPESPEDVEMSAQLLPGGAMNDFDSPWFGQPFRLRGVLRDGTQFVVSLSLTECAELLVLFEGDASVRNWAEIRAARLSPRGIARES